MSGNYCKPHHRWHCAQCRVAASALENFRIADEARRAKRSLKQAAYNERRANESESLLPLGELVAVSVARIDTTKHCPLLRRFGFAMVRGTLAAL